MEAATIITIATKLTYSTETAHELADKLVESIGALERDAYLSAISQWKAKYAANAAAVRQARIDRKGDASGYHQGLRQEYRRIGRQLMEVRGALKELARRHRASKIAPEV